MTFPPRRSVRVAQEHCLPLILPCSQSTSIQSNPALAIALERCVPGSICQAPKETPFPLFSAARRVLAFCITDAMFGDALKSCRLDDDMSYTTLSVRMDEYIALTMLGETLKHRWFIRSDLEKHGIIRVLILAYLLIVFAQETAQSLMFTRVFNNRHREKNYT